MRLFRRRPVPDVVRAVALPDGERRVTWALTTAGEPVVVTDRGLLLPGRPLLGWDAVERAVWKRPVLRLVELEPTPAPVSGAGRVTEVELVDDDGGVPDAVQAGVTASVAWTTHVSLPGGGGVRVVGRRGAAGDDLDWQTVFDPGTDVHDPAVRAQAAALVSRSKRTIG